MICATFRRDIDPTLLGAPHEAEIYQWGENLYLQLSDACPDDKACWFIGKATKPKSRCLRSVMKGLKWNPDEHQIVKSFYRYNIVFYAKR